MIEGKIHAKNAVHCFLAVSYDAMYYDSYSLDSTLDDKNFNRKISKMNSCSSAITSISNKLQADGHHTILMVNHWSSKQFGDNNLLV